MAIQSELDAGLAELVAKATDDSAEDDARVEAIGAIEDAAEGSSLPDGALAALLSLLEASSEDVRRAAIGALERCPTSPAVGPLLAALARLKRDDPRWVHGMESQDIFSALGTCGVGDPASIDALCAHLHVEGAMYAARGAYLALVAMGPKAARAKGALEERVASGPAWEVAHAHLSLWAIDGDADRHASALAMLLTETKEGGGSTAAAATLALEKMGEAALATLDRIGAGKGAVAKKSLAVAERIRVRAQKRAAREANR
jgi:hypothetical protein